MKKNRTFKTLEQGILLLQSEAKKAPISIAKILHILSGRGRSLIVILLSLPFCQPIQIPGFSTLFGLAIAFVALRMAFGKQIWLPKKVLSKKIPKHTFHKITAKTLWLTKKIKPWIHPRLFWLSGSPVMRLLNALLIFILGIILALPLPIPFSNLTAAWSLFLIGLGTLENDGVFILIGYATSLITFTFLTIVIFTLKSVF